MTRKKPIDELAGIYEPKTKTKRGYNVNSFIDIIYSPWAVETRGSEGAFFHFGAGKVAWFHQSESLVTGVLPVRGGK